MGTSDLLKARHKDTRVSAFRINIIPQAQFKSKNAVSVLLFTMFPSTYICKSFGFFNKFYQEQKRLSSAHLGKCLRIATTKYRSGIRRINFFIL